VNAVRGSNRDVGARTLEVSEREVYLRGRGRITTIADLEQIAVGTTEAGTPVRIADLGRVQLGPNLRRGVSDLDGLGDTVGGIVVMRHGENALNVIERVKAKLEEVQLS